MRVQVVWAGMNDFELSFDDGDAATHAPLVTGLAQMRVKHADGVNAELDQFIVRTINGSLLEERIVRLPNGFPTTDREADAFDAEAAKKDAAMAQIARNMIKGAACFALVLFSVNDVAVAHDGGVALQRIRACLRASSSTRGPRRRTRRSSSPMSRAIAAARPSIRCASAGVRWLTICGHVSDVGRAAEVLPGEG